ncbi:hypothetical protein [Streptomyces sp. NPDC046832]|uniref:hypothetical protein n=1 Tax=Streptomyces sp. NPDC046832 TaxID=3155020 RepID=UPI0033F59315
MVTSAHEGMHRIFQERPEILSPVFGVLGIAFPEKAAVYAIGTDVTEARPLARHIDTVLRIGPSDGEDFLLAVEAQERRDTKKESSWPYYVSYLQAKYGLPVLLLVVCRDRATTKWATGPFSCGTRGWIAQMTYPLVVGPDNLPMITDPRTAAEKPAMAVLRSGSRQQPPHRRHTGRTGPCPRRDGLERRQLFLSVSRLGVGGHPRRRQMEGHRDVRQLLPRPGHGDGEGLPRG